MLIRNGIDTSEANAKYFQETLPKLAEERISGANRDEMLKQLRDAAQQASAAYTRTAQFCRATHSSTMQRRKMDRE